MRTRQVWGRGLASGLVLAGAMGLAAGPATAQETEVVLALSHDGLAAMMPDEKDAALLSALRMIPERWDEVAPEVPDLDARTASMIRTLVTTLARPAHVVVTSSPGNAEGGALGYGVIVSIDAGGRDEADGLHRLAGGLLQQAKVEALPKASQRFPGMSEFQAAQAALVRFGPQERGGAWFYDVYVGSVEEPAAVLGRAEPDQAGFDSVLEFRFDTAGLETAYAMARGAAAGDPNAARFFDMIDEMDLFGEESIAVDVSSGFTDGASVTYTVLENAGKLKDDLFLPEGSLTGEDLGAIPADAEMVWMGKDDFTSIRGMIEEAQRSGMDVQSALDEFEEETGVDLMTDVVDALGGTIAVYTSDATGGGSLMSAVGMISFRDRARFAEANEALVGLANIAAQQIPIPISSIGVEIASWEHDGVELFSVRVAGAPMPIELSYALTEEWLIFGITPQAVIAAARQAEGRGDGGLLTSETFAGAFPRGKELISLSYADAPRLIRQGYPLMTLFSSAMGNLVRSPLEPQRDPGLIVAPMHDLARGAAPQIEFTYWRGADLVTETHADRSMVVNGAVAAGALNRIAPAIAAIVAAISGAQQRGGMGGFGHAMPPDQMVDGLRIQSLLPGGYGPRRLVEMAAHFAAVAGSDPDAPMYHEGPARVEPVPAP